MGEMVPDLNNALSNLVVTFESKAAQWASEAASRQRQIDGDRPPGVPATSIPPVESAAEVSRWYTRFANAAREGFAFYSECTSPEGPPVFSDVPSYYNVFQEAVKQSRARYSWDHAPGSDGSGTTRGMEGRFRS